MGIGEIQVIPPLTLQFAFKEGSEASSYLLSRSWTELHTIFHLSSRNATLYYITFLVCDDQLATEDLLIGLSVLRPLR